jgi:tetratricopeptide (TPR) repeat protein
MKNKSFPGFLILLTCFLFLGFSDSYSETKASLNKRLQKEYYSFDSTEYRSILRSINWELKKTPDDFALHYYGAIAEMNLCRILYGTNKPKAKAAIESASKHADFLTKVIEVPEKKKKLGIKKNEVAEVYALHSAIYGLRAGLDLLKKIKYGKIAQATIEKAHEMTPENPKVLLIGAKHLMCIPEMFGGDKERAEQLLNTALANYSPGAALFKNVAGEKQYKYIDWASHAELYAYLAQLELFRDNQTKAREYMNKALKYVPDYGYVLYDLELQFD